MERYVELVVLVIFSMILFGQGCKKAENTPKEKIERSSKTTAQSFEDIIDEEVEKIPPPEEEWGGVAEEPLGE
jgi:hypothetical protein